MADCLSLADMVQVVLRQSLENPTDNALPKVDLTRVAV